MRWLLIPIIVILGLLTILQHNQIIELRDDAVVIQEYVFSLEEQAQVLHERVVTLTQRNRDVSLKCSVALVERDECLARNEEEPIATPQKRINVSDLNISADAATINVEELVPGIIAPTGSMLPLLQEDTIVLEKIPESHNELLPGDIIIFQYKDSRIIHRIVEIGWDSNGWYAYTKGDNNPLVDPFKVRFADVKGVVVGIIY